MLSSLDLIDIRYSWILIIVTHYIDLNMLLQLFSFFFGEVDFSKYCLNLFGWNFHLQFIVPTLKFDQQLNFFFALLDEMFCMPAGIFQVFLICKIAVLWSYVGRFNVKPIFKYWVICIVRIFTEAVHINIIWMLNILYKIN